MQFEKAETVGGRERDRRNREGGTAPLVFSPSNSVSDRRATARGRATDVSRWTRRRRRMMMAAIRLNYDRDRPGQITSVTEERSGGGDRS